MAMSMQRKSIIPGLRRRGARQKNTLVTIYVLRINEVILYFTKTKSRNNCLQALLTIVKEKQGMRHLVNPCTYYPQSSLVPHKTVSYNQSLEIHGKLYLLIPWESIKNSFRR